jgi:signal transduction histidine kinase
MDAPSRRDGVSPEPAGLSLEWKIPLLMTVVLAMGMAAMLAITYTTLLRRAEVVVRDRLAHAAAEVAGSARARVDEDVVELSRVAADASVRRMLAVRPVRVEDRASAERLLGRIREPRDSVFTAELWDVRGRTAVHAGARLPAQGSGPRPSRAAASGPWISPMWVAGGRARYWVAVPVRHAGVQVGWAARLHRVSGAAGGTRRLRELTREDVSIYVRNADQSVWVAAPSQVVEEPVRTDSSLEGLTYQREGSGLNVAAEAEVAGTPWRLVLEVPLASVVSRPRRTVKLLAQLSVALVLGGALLSWWIGRQITRPVRALTVAAEKVALGTYPGVVDAGGDEIGRLAASFDLMARQVESARHALEQRADEAQRARETAEEANRSKTNFLSAMSHELRTPLNAIGGYAQLMEMGLHGPVTAEQREVLTRIVRSQAHLLALIEDLLGFAQLEAGRVRFAVEEVRLSETVAELEGLVETQAAARKVRLGFAATGPGIRAMADRDKVRQVALNLVVNAIKFTPEGGEVAVECMAEADRVRLQVRDTGIGIPTEQLERIFEPFVQGERAPDRAAEGVGLGLAISRELARGMGGEVTVASAPGAGSTFTLILPRANGERVPV